MRAKVFDIQVANWLVDKLVVDLANFNMSEDTSAPMSHIPISDGISHNSARFNIQLWVDYDNGVHVELTQPKIHGKYLPGNSVLSCLSDFCHNRESADSDSLNGVIQVIGVTEVTVNNIHIRASPSSNGLPWHDNILAVSYTHLTLPTICSV